MSSSRWTRHTVGLLVGTTLAGIVAVTAIGVAGATAGASAAASGTVPASTAVTPGTAAPTGTGTSSGPLRTITVSGEGKVTVKPDMVTVSLGAQATAATASQAMTEMNERMTALLAALKAAGVPDDQITTYGLNVNANYDSNNRVSGFTASNTVSVKIYELDKAGSIIDAAAKAAGDAVTIGGISFGLRDQETVLGDARRAAIANATKRANEFAQAAGAAVGAVITISEVGVSTPVLYEARDAAPMASGAAASIAVMSGTQDVTVNVTVVYALTVG